MRMPVALSTAFATARIGDRFSSFEFAGTLIVLRSTAGADCGDFKSTRSGGRRRGGGEAAFSSMASNRASGIRRRHSTKVVARLSFGRAAPTRAQLIPFVSRCYGWIVGLAMRGRFDIRGGQIVESSHLYLGLMAEGKRAAVRLAAIDGRQDCARKS